MPPVSIVRVHTRVINPFSKAYGPTSRFRRLSARHLCVLFYHRQSCSSAINLGVHEIVAVITVSSAYIVLLVQRWGGQGRDILCWIAAARERDVLYYSPSKIRGSGGASLYGNGPVIVVVVVLAARDFRELFIRDVGRGIGKPAAGYRRREKLPGRRR